MTPSSETLSFGKPRAKRKTPPDTLHARTVPAPNVTAQALDLIQPQIESVRTPFETCCRNETSPDSCRDPDAERLTCISEGTDASLELEGSPHRDTRSVDISRRMGTIRT